MRPIALTVRCSTSAWSCSVVLNETSARARSDPWDQENIHGFDQSEGSSKGPIYRTLPGRKSAGKSKAALIAIRSRAGRSNSSSTWPQGASCRFLRASFNIGSHSFITAMNRLFAASTRARSAGVRGAGKPLPIGGTPGNGRKLIVGESSAQETHAASAASTEPKRAVSVTTVSWGSLISSSVSAPRAAAGPKRRLSYAFSRGLLLRALGEKRGCRCQVAKLKPAASTGSRASARAIKRTP